VTSTHQFTLEGRLRLDARIYVTPGPHKIDAYGLAFDDGANIRAETNSTGYIGYCRACIAYHELHRLIAGRWGIESETIADAVEGRFPHGCTCDD
jgi:hypothetical protein